MNMSAPKSMNPKYQAPTQFESPGFMFNFLAEKNFNF